MKLVETSIRRRVTIAMFTVAVVLFGFVSFTRLKLSLLPELSYPTLTVRTEYTGAAPAEIENLVSKPIEEAVGVVKNVRKVSSISRTGQSDVLLEFNWGTKMDLASLEVREKLDSLELPLELSGRRFCVLIPLLIRSFAWDFSVSLARPLCPLHPLHPVRPIRPISPIRPMSPSHKSMKKA